MKLRTNTLLPPLLLFICLITQAQNTKPIKNNRTEKPLGLSIYAGSPTLIASLAVDYFVTPRISLEAGGGLFGIYGGSRYHFNGNRPNKKWTTYAGLLFAAYGEAVGTDYMFFVPIGKQYISDTGFNFAAEISLLSDVSPFYYPIWFGIKFGYRF